MGITLDTLTDWYGRSATVGMVRMLTPQTAASIYRRNYWNEAYGPELPAGLDLAAFDFGVNAGPGRSVRMLQGVAGVRADGVIGPESLAAIQAMGVAAAIEKLAAAQAAYYQGLGDPEFIDGWLARTTRRKVTALGMAGGG